MILDGNSDYQEGIKSIRNGKYVHKYKGLFFLFISSKLISSKYAHLKKNSIMDLITYVDEPINMHNQYLL